VTETRGTQARTTDPHPRPRLSVKVGAAVVLVVVAITCAALFSATAPRGESTVIDADPQTHAPVAAGIFVHILGEVQSPGLYELREGDRAVDAVAAAGGFTEDADQSQLNLARFVTDGEQIVVPKVGETPPVTSGGPTDGVDGSGKVNLNTADASQLETLPRIGPAMAARIIAWRDENGRFTAVEDLLSVTGIGEKTFDGLRELVTV
jgi:competence protein ComEA